MSQSRSTTSLMISAWKNMLLNPPDVLLNYLAATIVKTNNVHVLKQDVAEFIHTYIAFGNEPEPKKPARIISDRCQYVETNYQGESKRTKPQSFTFDGKEIQVSTWTDLVQQLCQRIADQNPTQFHEVLNHIVGRDRNYFSLNKNELRKPKSIQNTNIYVDVHGSANNKYSLAQALCKKFGYPQDLKIKYWPVPPPAHHI